MKRNPTFALGFVPQPNLQNSPFFGLAKVLFKKTGFLAGDDFNHSSAGRRPSAYYERCGRYASQSTIGSGKD
ncbi:hypothetical protein ACE1CM_42435 [Microseira sp. BLCC-F43]